MSQKALIVEALGSPVVLTQRPIPEPKEGELLIKIEVAGFNPHDSYSQQWGLFIGKSLPSPLAIDIVGTVSKLGPGVTKFQLGDRVFTLGVPTNPDRTGTQEYSLADAKYTSKPPARFSSDEVATMVLNPFTAFLSLFSKQGLDLPRPEAPGSKKSYDHSGLTIVVLGGGSACGKYTIQFAKYAGIGKIITVASKQKTESLLKSYGATHVIDRHGTIDEINAEVRKLTGDDLVSVIDCVNYGPGGHTLGAKLLSNSKKGKLVLVVPHGDVDESQIGEKAAGFEKLPIASGNYSQSDLVEFYFEKAPLKMDSGTIVPTPFSVIKGLDAEKVNEALDAYKNNTPIVKPHVHL